MAWETWHGWKVQIQGFSPGILAPDSRLLATGKSSLDSGADLCVLTVKAVRRDTERGWCGERKAEKRRGVASVKEGGGQLLGLREGEKNARGQKEKWTERAWSFSIFLRSPLSSPHWLYSSLWPTSMLPSSGNETNELATQGEKSFLYQRPRFSAAVLSVQGLPFIPVAVLGNLGSAEHVPVARKLHSYQA